MKTRPKLSKKRVDGLTDTQQRMMVVLKDGLPHPLEHLLPCLWDEMASPSVVHSHMYKLRKVLLKTKNEGVLLEVRKKKAFYRWVGFKSAPVGEVATAPISEVGHTDPII